MATAVVVALASATYALFDQRARNAERKLALEREARAVASSLRVSLETNASAFRTPSDEVLRDLSRASGGWKVVVLPRARAVETAERRAHRAPAPPPPHDARCAPALVRGRRRGPVLLLAADPCRRCAARRAPDPRDARDQQVRRLDRSDHRRPGARHGTRAVDRRRHHRDGRRPREPPRQPPDHQAPARHRRRRQGRPVARDPLRTRRRDRRDRRPGSTT